MAVRVVLRSEGAGPETRDYPTGISFQYDDDGALTVYSGDKVDQFVALFAPGVWAYAERLDTDTPSEPDA